MCVMFPSNCSSGYGEKVEMNDNQFIGGQETEKVRGGEHTCQKSNGLYIQERDFSSSGRDKGNHVCIHRCAFVCKYMMQRGQCQLPLPDCVCTLSEKQYASLNSWHSPSWMSPICVFLKHSTKWAWQPGLGQNISRNDVPNVLGLIFGRAVQRPWAPCWGIFKFLNSPNCLQIFWDSEVLAAHINLFIPDTQLCLGKNCSLPLGGDLFFWICLSDRSFSEG